MSDRRGITLLGSTGSIGASTLDVVARHRERFDVIALTAHRDWQGLHRQCVDFAPRYAVMIDADGAERLAARLRADGSDTQVLCGEDALVRVAGLPEVACVMAAIVGAAGLLPTLEAVRCGKRVLLANKEALVMSGALFMDEVVRSGAHLLPVDSEHNAIFQCMPAGFEPGHGAPEGVERVVLTASGGPFRLTPIERLATVTPDQACAHPTWDMGRKISVDSATMMNKGLEVIEASWLFALAADAIDVVIHPQSLVHSLVRYRDGSVLAQLGEPDMRTPIAHALAWPERIDSGVSALDLLAAGTLEFAAPDDARFPCLALAREALSRGGTACATLNAANEVAVQAFLDRRISFTAIPDVIEAVLTQAAVKPAVSLDAVLAADADARSSAGEYIRTSQRQAMS